MGVVYILVTFVLATLLYAGVQNSEHKQPLDAALWGKSVAVGALAALAVAAVFVLWPRLSGIR